MIDGLRPYRHKMNNCVLLTAPKCIVQVDLRHIDERNGTNVVEVGVDLSNFYKSVEWDILEVPAVR